MVSGGLVAVDLEGKAWRKIPAPRGARCGTIDQAQGRLCYISQFHDDVSSLPVWILEDYGSDEWTLKHKISTLYLFGRKSFGPLFDFRVIAVHPERNLMYFVYGMENTLMTYEMDHGEVRVICDLGRKSTFPCLPYVPLFSESLAGGQS